MDRRTFCKMAAMTAGALGLTRLGGLAMTIPSGAKATVTVLRRECYDDLQSLYLSDPEAGRCQAFKHGEKFNLTSMKPEGFCPKAWEAIQNAIRDYSPCPSAAPSDPMVIIASCPDGTRPVIFKIEINN